MARPLPPEAIPAAGMLAACVFYLLQDESPSTMIAQWQGAHREVWGSQSLALPPALAGLSPISLSPAREASTGLNFRLLVRPVRPADRAV